MRCSIRARAIIWPRWSMPTAANPVGHGLGRAFDRADFMRPCFRDRQLADELARIGPAECLIDERSRRGRPRRPTDRVANDLTRRPAWAFSLGHRHASAVQTLRHRHAGRLWLRRRARCPGAAGRRRDARLSDRNAKERRSRISTGCCRITPARRWRSTKRRAAAWRSRTRCAKGGAKARCWPCWIARHRMGSRLLADWVANPLTDLAAIDERLDAVAELVADSRLGRRAARQAARHLRPRAAAGPRHHRPGQPARSALRRPHAGRVAGDQGQAHRPQKRAAFAAGSGTRSVPRDSRASWKRRWSTIARCKAAKAASSAPAISAELDDLRELAAGGKQWIARYQAEEAARTGIPSLKVGFNKVFGYYIEITHTHGAQNSRRTTSASRRSRTPSAYITPELKEYEEKVLTAEEKAKELEYELFVAAARARGRPGAADCKPRPRCWRSSTCWRRWPSWPGARNYCRPTIRRRADAGDHRRPASGARFADADGTFVPNDCVRSAATTG